MLKIMKKLNKTKKKARKKKKQISNLSKNLFYSNKTKTLSTPLLMLFYIICITTTTVLYNVYGINLHKMLIPQKHIIA